MPRIEHIGVRLIDSALFIGFFSLLSYASAYLIEVGYLAYFNIGFDLAQPQYKYMLQYAPFIVVIIIGLLLLVQLTILWATNIKNRWIKLLSFNLLAPLFIAVLAVAIPGPEFSKDRFYAAFSVVFNMLTFFLIVYLVVFLISTYVLRLRKFDKYVASLWKKMKMRFTPHRKIFIITFVLSYGLLLLASYPVAIGYHIAGQKKIMPIFFYQGKYFAAIRQYENYWLALEYDVKYQKLKTETYHYMPVKDMSGFELKSVKVK